MIFFDAIRYNNSALITDKFKRGYYSGEMVLFILLNISKYVNIVFLLLDRLIYKIKLTSIKKK